MTMSPIKTLAIVFGKTLKRKPIIKLRTITLPVKEYTRYLGVILDQKLNFSKYINTSLEKARAQLNKILTLANRQYNIHPRKFRVCYNAIFLSTAHMELKYLRINTRKSAIGEKSSIQSNPPEDVQSVFNNICGKLTDSHRHATIRFANCNKGMKTQL